MRRTTIALALVAAVLVTGVAYTQDSTAPEITQEQLDKLKQDIKELEKRVQKTERQNALDRVRFSGDFRFEAHSIDATIPDHFDGMQLQRMMVDNLFYVGATGGQFPPSQEAVQELIRTNYSDYLFYTSNLSFEDLKSIVGSFPPEMLNQFMGMLLPSTYQPGYDFSNDLLYTNRLRLQLDADVAKDVTFSGRLAMYKTFGDSTGVQVFNGQPTSINVDGTTASVPNGDMLRVERAYFNWNNIGDLPMYLSIGRRPSTGGVPLNFRNDEPRGGSPLGSIINYQFDGITWGYHFGEHSTFRLCYGVGYESGYGNGQELQLPQDRLDDAWFLGVNWDIWDSEDWFVQATVAQAFDVTDGFNGLVVLPVDPVTGQTVPAPVVLRYTPSANLGDIFWASVVAVNHLGPVDWFASVNYMETDPNGITTPFGGLLSDPFSTPEKQDGTMYYVGVRYNFANDKTKAGLEYNHGSEYWFNFAVAEDDLLAPKTNTRGDVFEAYVTHRIRDRFIFKLDYIHYEYDYSGSGWHLGAPKPVDEASILGFPTFDQADKYMLSFLAKF